MIIIVLCFVKKKKIESVLSQYFDLVSNTPLIMSRSIVKKLCNSRMDKICLFQVHIKRQIIKWLRLFTLDFEKLELAFKILKIVLYNYIV